MDQSLTNLIKELSETLGVTVTKTEYITPGESENKIELFWLNDFVTWKSESHKFDSQEKAIEGIKALVTINKVTHANPAYTNRP